MTQKQMLAMLRKLINDEQATGFTEGGNLEQPEGTQELLHSSEKIPGPFSQLQEAIPYSTRTFRSSLNT